MWMAAASFWLLHLFLFHGFMFLINPSFFSQIWFVSASKEDFSIVSSDFDMFGHDYSPPSPPPNPPLPNPPSVSCEEDLKGIGSLNTSCKLDTSLQLEDDVYIEGKGSLHILPGVSVSCPVSGCSIFVNISGNFSLGQNASIVAGTFVLIAHNSSFLDGSIINTTGLGGPAPSQTSGTPQGIDGAGGGHGGRGASCSTDKTKLPDDVWGGDAYSWSSLAKPLSYGSRGGTTSKEEDYGGGGGGRVKVVIGNFLEANGTVLADGGNGGLKGGGGSGGSIYISSHKM